MSSNGKRDVVYRESDKDVWKEAKLRMELEMVLSTALRHLNEKVEAARKSFDKLVKG